MMSDKLSVEAIEMLADDYERGMIGPRRLRQYFDYLIQQLAAANARIAELEQQHKEQTDNYYDCITEKRQAEFNAKHFESLYRTAKVEFNFKDSECDRLQEEIEALKISNAIDAAGNEQFQKAFERAEQAEASCAAMRLRFEKYVRENCKLIRHSVADGLGKPDDVEGKCGGYAQNGDEPHYICQECVAAYDPEDEYNENVIAAGSALLAELQRYREALEKIVGLQYKENYIYFGVHVACKYAEQALGAALSASSSAQRAPAEEDAQ